MCVCVFTCLAHFVGVDSFCLIEKRVRRERGELCLQNSHAQSIQNRGEKVFIYRKLVDYFISKNKVRAILGK